MEPMEPTPGRIVIFKLADYQKANPEFQNNGSDTCPAIVVRAWSATCVNLRLLTNGPNTPWVTSVLFGTEDGQWSWPERK